MSVWRRVTGRTVFRGSAAHAIEVAAAKLCLDIPAIHEYPSRRSVPWRDIKALAWESGYSTTAVVRVVDGRGRQRTREAVSAAASALGIAMPVPSPRPRQSRRRQAAQPDSRGS